MYPGQYKDLLAHRHSFGLFFIYVTYTGHQKYTFIQYILPLQALNFTLVFFFADHWATSHPNELCHTLNWNTAHPSELRRSRTNSLMLYVAPWLSFAATKLSYVAPYKYINP